MLLFRILSISSVCVLSVSCNVKSRHEPRAFSSPYFGCFYEKEIVYPSSGIHHKRNPKKGGNHACSLRLPMSVYVCVRRLLRLSALIHYCWPRLWHDWYLGPTRGLVRRAKNRRNKRKRLVRQCRHTSWRVLARRNTHSMCYWLS